MLPFGIVHIDISICPYEYLNEHEELNYLHTPKSKVNYNLKKEKLIGPNVIYIFMNLVWG